MQIDREDGVLSGRHEAPRATDPAPRDTPRAWFIDPAPAVAVIVKKRRMLDLPSAGLSEIPAANDGAASDARRPRVFVLPKESPAPDAAPDAAPIRAADSTAAATLPGFTAGTSTAAETQPVRRRRRRLPAHRPSPVVHIAVPAPESPPVAAANDAEPGGDFVLNLPSLQAWHDVQTALASVRRLVQDAEHASRWGASLAAQGRRQRG